MTEGLRNHIDELAKRRDAIKGQIVQERSSPAVDEAKVASLKKRNLLLKDRIERLRAA